MIAELAHVMCSVHVTSIYAVGHGHSRSDATVAARRSRNRVSSCTALIFETGFRTLAKNGT